MEKTTIKYGEKVKLDEKDKKVLEHLYKNARVPVSEISRKTGIQRDSVIYRIKRMEKLNVIRSYTVLLNPLMLGYPIYSFVDIELHNFDEKSEKSFLGFLKSHPQITYVAKLTGKWDYEIVISAKDLGEFEDILKQMRLRFSDIIKNYESSMILQEYKFDYFLDLISINN